eukprot:Gb_00785 [translate_table: standard]
MSFASSPARKGLQSPLSMGKGSPRLKNSKCISSPDPHARKKKVEEDHTIKVVTPFTASENCDPNSSAKEADGTQKFKISETPIFAVASGIHSCKSRRCASNNPDWASARPQPRKFLVAKRHLQPPPEPVRCKCSEKKCSADKSARRKCVCVASKQLRDSQEDFVKENFGREPLDYREEEDAETSRESDSQAAENDNDSETHHHNAQVEIENFELGNDGKREISLCNGKGTKGLCEIKDSGKHEENQCQNEGRNGVSEIEGDGKHEEIQSEEEAINGASEMVGDGKQEEIQCVEVGTNGFPEDEIRCSTEGSCRFSDLRIGKIHCVEEVTSGLPLPDATECSSPQRVSTATRRMRNELLEEAINTIPQQGGGRVKHLVKAFESLMCLPDTVATEGYQARPLDKSIYNVSDFDQSKHQVGVGRGFKWALPGMQPQVTEEKTNCSSHESYADFKFSISEDAASVGQSDTQSVSSFGRSESSYASRRRSNKESLDFSGRGSIGKNGTQQWKKQLKVTGAQPFKLRTEQRGHMKEREFMKKVHEMLSEEERLRIPIAQGLPWTTDEPQCLLKPPVKESTKPVDIKLHTELRAVDRAEFDQIIAEKLSFMEQQRLEEERLQKLAEEEEIKRLRKELVPRAQPMPFFDRPFIPKRSSKNPTIPKEPKFHIPHHKKAKSLSWNDFNVCQQ